MTSTAFALISLQSEKTRETESRTWTYTVFARYGHSSQVASSIGRIVANLHSLIGMTLSCVIVMLRQAAHRSLVESCSILLFLIQFVSCVSSVQFEAETLNY